VAQRKSIRLTGYVRGAMHDSIIMNPERFVPSGCEFGKNSIEAQAERMNILHSVEKMLLIFIICVEELVRQDCQIH